MPPSSLPYRVQKRRLTIKQKRRNKADNTTQPVSGQHFNRDSNATTRGSGALLPGLPSTCCIFNGGVHTDTIASIAREGTQKQKQKEQSMRGKNTETKKAKKGTKGRRGTRTPAVVVPRNRLTWSNTAPLRGMEQAIQRTTGSILVVQPLAVYWQYSTLAVYCQYTGSALAVHW